LGSNDGLRGLDVKTSSRNLENIIQKAQSANIKVILAGLQIPPNYGPKYTNSFKKMIPALAKKYRLPFIPFLLDGVAGVPQNNQIDGIHPNEAGHQIITQNILLILNKNL
jgi:acyl-CoA thioesterase-1